MKSWFTMINRVSIGFAVLATVAIVMPMANAQDPQLEEKVAGIKASQAANKQKLAQYTWTEQETISIKGEVKDTKDYQVHVGPDGQDQKTETNNDPAQQGGREGRVKKRVVTHVTDEYQQYGQQIAALAKQYVPPDPQKLDQAYKQGNISLQSGGGGEVRLVIKNFVKPSDSVTLTINGQTKTLSSASIASYLSDPKDAVTITVQFSQLPDGTNYPSNTVINGVSKHLTVNQTNTNFTKL